MQGHDARILRGAAIPTAVIGVLGVIVGSLMAGSKGAIGAAIGAAVVLAFFSISHFAVSYASKISPQAMMQIALLAYTVKIFLMFGLIIALRGVTFWDQKIFALAVIVGTLAWVVAEIRATTKAKMLYVDPSGKG